MPYIKPEERPELDLAIHTLAEVLINQGDSIEERITYCRAGRLNYAISRLLDLCYELKDKPKYRNFNAALGVLECVKLELYRRLAAPYEDKKIQENGDVF